MNAITQSPANFSQEREDYQREAEKMQAMGRLAGGIAHDFNNLLTGILLYCDLIRGQLESEAGEGDSKAGDGEWAELCRHVEEIRRAGEQGAAITQQLLAISRKQADELGPVRVNKVIISVENLLRRLIGEQIELVLSLDPALDSALEGRLVIADPAQVKQLLLNLVLNARDAMPGGGRITVSTRAADLREEAAEDSLSRTSRPAVALAVTDNGCGMDAETRARLFEPFFTTKKPGAGTGLGLATVHRIVSESHGTISVDSVTGRGTRIEVCLPLWEGADGNFTTSDGVDP